MLIQMHLITLFRVMNPHQRCLQAKVKYQYRITHWVDTWWANGYVSPSQMAVVDRLDLKISDYIKSKAI